MTADGRTPSIHTIEAVEQQIADGRASQISTAVQAVLAPFSQAALPSARPVATPDTPPLFTTISADPELQQLLTNRWKECVGCVEHDLALAAIVMMGGLLEGLFLVRIEGLADKAPVFQANAAPRDKTTGQTLGLKDWVLSNYIDVAHELAWISETYRDVGEILRDYRNYIHPHKEHRHKKRLSPADSRMLWEISKHVARELVKP
ncbi:MAG TPA: hypothetical protein VME17_14585 [Bryobacteraceae bacterium]|nr:hypothetical protein [Bryobacteraceae bacterium]